MSSAESIPSKKEQTLLDDRFALFCFLWFGGTSAVGWNVVNNCIDYFTFMYPQYEVKFVFSLPYYASQVLLSLIITPLRQCLLV